MMRAMALMVAATVLGACVPSHRVATEPAPQIDCTPGPFIAFFDRDSAALDSANREVFGSVKEVATVGICWSHARLLISGHKEAEERDGISRARALAVRDYLVSLGVAGKRIQIEDSGSAYPRVAEIAGTPNRENRRVEIVFGPR
jgi:OmpA-OmpF porin, OOP family